MSARIEKAVVSGVSSLDGQDFDVDDDVWLVGDDEEVLVIDAPHRVGPIVEAVGGRRVTAIALTHGHDDHVTAAVDLREATGAPIWSHPADQMLWDVVHGGPGATGRSSGDHPTIVRSIRDTLPPLPGDTVVRTGHGDDTTIAAEAGRAG
ncbi:Metallo-beta-lactamase superfamily protein [Geodermatophilus dictyosporus]|uniref:Metallo-beta-lactamase superfamily protein n=1 Tax=Geodermatophilus dictyosporus TaxID=1523247 RepID=A0A1I5QRK8_9ACTN|nr:MBL fold metallo-hydrolase [Geodermatophilus dictyosporus]SFP48466.1 Metallo-beta-lactamase superfamily protein [Geodermatophilus dictyosporus]